MNTKLTFDQIVDGEGDFVPGIPCLGPFKRATPHVLCADGESLSVQAGYYLYSTPKDNVGPYTEVEVGFPSVSPPDTWAEYFDGDWDTEDHTSGVYGYVPVALVREFIKAHGGEVHTVTDLDALKEK